MAEDAKETPPTGISATKPPPSRLWRVAPWLVVAGMFVAAVILIGVDQGLWGAFLLTLGVAFATGLVLDRVDPGRHPREGRPSDEVSQPDAHWGFRGRPGS